MKPDTHKLIMAGLESGLTNRIAKIYDNLSSAGEKDREKRFRTGLDHAITAFERACEIIDETKVS